MSKSKLTCGIVGLPNVGKSTLFNALIKKRQAGASNYPFCTIDPNIGIVDVPDPRLEHLARLSKSEKIIPASIAFVDIAGLVKGAAKGEGLGNQFLANIRETDLILHLVRCFEDDNITHVEGKINPLSDIEVIHLELILADLQMAENIIQKLERQVKGNKKLLPTLDAMGKIKSHLEKNQPVRLLTLTKEEKESTKNYPFLTNKKIIYIANVSEDDLPEMENNYVKQVRDKAQKEKNLFIAICAKLEEELVSLNKKETEEYLQAIGLKETGLNRLIQASFEALQLMTFLTTGEKETRAWTLPKGSLAPEAAGVIHTDMQKGFIRAEVIRYEDIITYQGRVKAKEQGKVRFEGKDYIVQDGDVIVFYHN